MELSAAQLAEFDEVLPPVTSARGDIAVYRVNHHTKQVFIQTSPGDGNMNEWRHTNGGYDSLMKLVGRSPDDASQVLTAPAPIVAVPVFPTPGMEPDSDS